MPDFRKQRKQRQAQQPSQTIAPVVPEDVYNVPIHSQNRETAPPANRETVPMPEDQVVKTSFYPTQQQLDKLDDLASEYNKRYRRQRKRIDRQDIIRHLIDQCTIESLTDL